MTEKIDKRKVAEDTEIKVALEDTCLSIDTVLLLEVIRNDGILVNMQLFNLILTDTETPINTVFIGLIGEDVVAELNADVVERFKGVYIANYLVSWLFMLGVALKEDEDAAVLLLEALPEKDLVYVHIFLLLPHNLEPDSLRVQIVPICFKASVPIREV